MSAPPGGPGSAPQGGGPDGVEAIPAEDRFLGATPAVPPPDPSAAPPPEPPRAATDPEPPAPDDPRDFEPPGAPR
jgi:hypothetical protein